MSTRTGSATWRLWGWFVIDTLGGIALRADVQNYPCSRSLCSKLTQSRPLLMCGLVRGFAVAPPPPRLSALITPSPIPIVILCTKYDIFQDVERCVRLPPVQAPDPRAPVVPLHGHNAPWGT